MALLIAHFNSFCPNFLILILQINCFSHVDSMSLFMDEMEPGRASFPLCEVALHLQDPNIVFVPSLNPQDSEGFYHLIDILLNDIMQMSLLVGRVAKHSSEPNYKVILML
jgi:dynein heavy chain